MAGPGLFASWLLLLLLALRVQRATQWPPIPVGIGAAHALTILFLMGWVLGIFWVILSLPSSARGLVTSGPFARVRHPLIAVSLFFLGLLTIASSRSWIVAAVWPLSYALAGFWVRFEERALEKRFGDAWREYAETVPRFLPRLGGRRRTGGVRDARMPGRADPG